MKFWNRLVWRRTRDHSLFISIWFTGFSSNKLCRLQWNIFIMEDLFPRYRVTRRDSYVGARRTYVPIRLHTIISYDSPILMWLTGGNNSKIDEVKHEATLILFTSKIILKAKQVRRWRNLRHGSLDTKRWRTNRQILCNRVKVYHFGYGNLKTLNIPITTKLSFNLV